MKFLKILTLCLIFLSCEKDNKSSPPHPGTEENSTETPDEIPLGDPSSQSNEIEEADESSSSKGENTPSTEAQSITEQTDQEEAPDTTTPPEEAAAPVSPSQGPSTSTSTSTSSNTNAVAAIPKIPSPNHKVEGLTPEKNKIIIERFLQNSYMFHYDTTIDSLAKETEVDPNKILYLCARLTNALKGQDIGIYDSKKVYKCK